MIYSNLFTNYNQKKIPNWLVLIFIVIFSIIFFINQFSKTLTQSKAASLRIKRWEVLNLTPYEATIYWQTDTKEKSWLIYGEKKDLLNKLAIDWRDSDNIKNNYFHHIVTIKNLIPGKTYYFNLILSDKKITSVNNQFFVFKTPLTMKSRTKLDPAIGRIVKENFQPLKDAIVFLYPGDDMVPLATITKETGEWLIPLNYFLNRNSLEEQIFTGEEKIIIEVITEEKEKKTIISNKLKNISLKNETYIIGKNYDNYNSSDVLSASTNTDYKLDKLILEILYPVNGAIIPGNKPLIKGKTYPHKEVFINIRSFKKTYTSKIVADNSGNWQYYLDEPLTKGKYELTAEVINDEKKIIKKSRIFNITGNEAIEGRVLGEATGEPTIVLKTPTPTTNSVIPTSTRVITPTLFKTGVNETLPFFLGIGLFSLGVGIFIVF